MEVEHVNGHRTKKEKEKMTQFERFVTEGMRRLLSWKKQEE